MATLNFERPRLINIHQLNFNYPLKSTPSLEGVDLTIPQGSLFGLLGPNGAGKTTLISILSGLLPYSSGSITINNDELKTLQQQNPVCALVPQSLAFYPQLTGKENLIFFASMLNIPKSMISTEIERCLSLTQLTQYADIRSATYSGGVKRRLNIAIGLLNSPKILFLDEPTVGIDAQSRNFILDSIKKINETGTTIIYTSHYMEEVESICSHIAIIDHGKILLNDDINSALSKKNTLTINTSAPLNAEELQTLRKSLNIKQQQCVLNIAIENHQQTITQALSLLNSMNINIEKIDYGTHNLEQLFLDKTHRTLRD